MSLRFIPNAICVARMLLVAPLVLWIVEGRYAAALVVLVVAGLSDGLDGFLAKRFEWQTRIGGLLDPAADKLLLVAVFVTTTWLGLVPWWLAAAAIGRDVMIALGALIFRLWFGPLRGRPTIVSKINTLLQLGYLLGVMMNAAFEFPPEEVVEALAVITLITTLLSGWDYIFAFTRRAWHEGAPSSGMTAATSAGRAGRH